MPSATAREFRRVAWRLGFNKTRGTASHERWSHPDGGGLTIPLHGGWEIGIIIPLLPASPRRLPFPLLGGKKIGPPLFFKILRQLGLTLEEFEKLR